MRLDNDILKEDTDNKICSVAINRHIVAFYLQFKVVIFFRFRF